MFQRLQQVEEPPHRRTSFSLLRTMAAEGFLGSVWGPQSSVGLELGDGAPAVALGPVGRVRSLPGDVRHESVIDLRNCGSGMVSICGLSGKRTSLRTVYEVWPTAGGRALLPKCGGEAQRETGWGRGKRETEQGGGREGETYTGAGEEGREVQREGDTGGDPEETGKDQVGAGTPREGDSEGQTAPVWGGVWGESRRPARPAPGSRLHTWPFAPLGASVWRWALGLVGVSFLLRVVEPPSLAPPPPLAITKRLSCTEPCVGAVDAHAHCAHTRCVLGRQRAPPPPRRPPATWWEAQTRKELLTPTCSLGQALLLSCSFVGSLTCSSDSGSDPVGQALFSLFHTHVDAPARSGNLPEGTQLEGVVGDRSYRWDSWGGFERGLPGRLRGSLRREGRAGTVGTGRTVLHRPPSAAATQGG